MSAGTVEVGSMLPETVIAGISRGEIGCYAEVSGDDNPVHSDDELAAKLGLEGVPVQGMFVMALVSNYLEQWEHHNSVRKLHIRFVSPAFAETDFTINARVMAVRAAEDTAVLRIFLKQRDALVAMGEAHIAVGVEP
ncbi:MaoC/PaaZ C-terminal domain-containing protein [Hoeflea sp.]|uniref:MaoC/PaaZ C-terminal domain-containing protein n=1 Tax=Hoeflea sp. TaxID=1940281 RepID=UPI003B52FABC